MNRILTASILAGLILSAKIMGEDLKPDQLLTYKQIGSTELKLHVFRPSASDFPPPRPATVFFFGGGWVGGSPTQFYPHCTYLASRGIVAMSAEYRVKERNGTSPRECVEDGKSAVRWIREHAEELGVDPDQIIAGGGSAGGHVAAATATIDGFEAENDHLDISCRPNALVLFNPVFDNGPEGYGYERVKDYWESFSPMHNISEATPPTIVFLGTQDRLIPVETARSYQKRMESYGRRCDLHLYEGQEHGFFNFKDRNNFDQTVIEMDKFLASLGYLEGEPTLHSVFPAPQNDAP